MSTSSSSAAWIKAVTSIRWALALAPGEAAPATAAEERAAEEEEEERRLFEDEEGVRGGDAKEMGEGGERTDGGNDVMLEGSVPDDVEDFIAGEGEEGGELAAEPMLMSLMDALTSSTRATSASSASWEPPTPKVSSRGRFFLASASQRTLKTYAPFCGSRPSRSNKALTWR